MPVPSSGETSLIALSQTFQSAQLKFDWISLTADPFRYGQSASVLTVTLVTYHDSRSYDYFAFIHTIKPTKKKQYLKLRKTTNIKSSYAVSIAHLSLTDLHNAGKKYYLILIYLTEQVVDVGHHYYSPTCSTFTYFLPPPLDGNLNLHSLPHKNRITIYWKYIFLKPNIKNRKNICR